MCGLPPGREDPRLTERELQDAVVQLAKMFSWRFAHFRPAMNRRGQWSTPMQGSIGFPDLVLVRGSRIIYAELKTEKGKIASPQQAWLDDLEAAGAEVRIWRPSDLDVIAEDLRSHERRGQSGVDTDGRTA